MKVRVRATCKNYIVVFGVFISVVALASYVRAQVRTVRDVPDCPPCDCGKTVVKTKGNFKTSDLAGCIIGALPQTGSIRVRILGVHSEGVRGTGLSDKNQFSFKDVPNGEYVLIVSQGTRFLGVNAIRLPSAFPVVMHIHLFPGFSFPVAKGIEY